MAASCSTTSALWVLTLFLDSTGATSTMAYLILFLGLPHLSAKVRGTPNLSHNRTEKHPELLVLSI